MSKNLLDNILFVIAICAVLTITAHKHGQINFTQYMTLLMAELTITLTSIKTYLDTNKKGDDK